MNTQINKVALRQNAFIINIKEPSPLSKLNETTINLIANCKKLGFGFSESLLVALNQITPVEKLELFELLSEVTGLKKNWTPLVKGWTLPTGESIIDHLQTQFANIFGIKNGVTLACGHTIPDNTFPLERYNGCPFCGTPFHFEGLQLEEQGNKLKILELWKDEDLQNHFADLLGSKVALDATQIDSLKILLQQLPYPESIDVLIKETKMIIIDHFVQSGQIKKAGSFFAVPNDILRYFWYKHTGFLQLIQPKVIKQRKVNNAIHLGSIIDNRAAEKLSATQKLKLKYSRAECRMAATWLNNLNCSPQAACENMHPKRGMWIRFIRALRLVEYAQKKNFEQLQAILNMFHAETYVVLAGQLEQFKLKSNAEGAFATLKKRPGLFSRSLFASILWFGVDTTLNHYQEISSQVPSRLLLTLNMYAHFYFDKNNTRVVKPLGGVQKTIPPNRLLAAYSDEELKVICQKITHFTEREMKNRFAALKATAQKVFIEPALYNIPVAIGDRSESIQDAQMALMGTRFKMESDQLRLFMQWGKGLPAQHLDMDLSCLVAYEHKTEFCSYSQLTIPGCQHSGDIINIPDKIGTAEYIEIDMQALSKAGAKYVSFTCNAYSNGSITPNLVVGWMNSKYSMSVSQKSGVAYDPSCVQHQVRITQGLNKGLVFGILDVAKNEVIWLEMPFGGQVVQGMDSKAVLSLLKKLESKISIGKLLAIKAEAQKSEIVLQKENAEMVYDLKWAGNLSQVMNELIV